MNSLILVLVLDLILVVVLLVQAIRGFEVSTLTPRDPTAASPMQPSRITLHPILTAETHNFPRLGMSDVINMHIPHTISYI